MQGYHQDDLAAAAVSYAELLLAAIYESREQLSIRSRYLKKFAESAGYLLDQNYFPYKLSVLGAERVE